MSYQRDRYNKEAALAFAEVNDIKKEVICRRARIYRSEDDWDLPPKTKTPIELKKGIIANRLKISTGHPISNGNGYFGYYVHCQSCGKNYQANINQIFGRSPRNCCQPGSKPVRRTKKRIAYYDVANGATFHPTLAQVKKYTAMFVRYYDQTINGNLCNGCIHTRACSDEFYECECHREDIKHNYEIGFTCALADAGKMRAGMPDMSVGKKSNVLPELVGKGADTTPAISPNPAFI